MSKLASLSLEALVYFVAIFLLLWATTGCQADGVDDHVAEACSQDAGFCIGTGTEGFTCCPTASPGWCAEGLECLPSGEQWTCQKP